MDVGALVTFKEIFLFYHNEHYHTIIMYIITATCFGLCIPRKIIYELAKLCEQYLLQMLLDIFLSKYIFA